MNNSSIKDNIRRFRKKNGFTQEEMADKLDISLTAYRDLEAGKTSIVNANVMRLAMLFNMSTEELVLGYRPLQTTDSVRLEDIRSEYSSRVSILERRISDLEKIVSSQEEVIRSKDEIILMLRKNLAGQK